ncbi:MAG: ATP-binding protein [Candidatus Parabeggiatoa sp.]|nr:ATP-binding protein [Candidatus Parabeggiatoa sp.]
MILQALKYCRYKGTKNQWNLEGRPLGNNSQFVGLDKINLVVGRNASGKTRTILAIRQVADLLCGDAKLSHLVHDTGEYTLLFKEKDSDIEYFFEFKKGKIRQEILKIDGEEKLNRAEGNLFYNEIGKYLSFKPKEDDSLSISKGDSEQQPFFDSLYAWGKTLTHYKFGGTLGKDAFIKDLNKILEQDSDIDLKDGSDVIEALVKGKEINYDFINAIIRDMDHIDYPLTSVDASRLKHIPIGFGLTVHEADLDDITDQLEMSQGMFRALSLLIQLNYSLLSDKPRCILIDDIGEGLDYDRSRKLIDLIIEKANNSAVQVIMTTNDRFVMNKVPLTYWSIIKRERNKSIFYNYQNSQKNFDDFSMTGLNNFDFFSTDFFSTGFDEYIAEAEE